MMKIFGFKQTVIDGLSGTTTALTAQLKNTYATIVHNNSDIMNNTNQHNSLFLKKSPNPNQNICL